jgi:dipeptidyl aminopeptidase/acylaminoacyl peptidase
MTQIKVAPYGSWKSPVTSDLIVSATVGLSQPVYDGEDVYWAEMRPTEGGRSCIVRRTPDGRTSDLTPRDFNARTRVHEYGGGDFAVGGGTLVFSNFGDQRLYRQTADSAPEPITPADELRYADCVIDARRGVIYAVREDHRDKTREAVNTIVRLALGGDAEGGAVLAEGNDFYSSPRLSPDGKRLAWLTWNHPNMPWDGTELWAGDLDEAGHVTARRKVAGGANESIFQPEWSPDGRLHFSSDASGWWNLRRENSDGRVELVLEMEAEFGLPQWGFGMSAYAFASADMIVCAYVVRGESRLGVVDAATRTLEPVETPYTDITYVRARRGRAVFRAASPVERAAVVEYDTHARAFKILRGASDAGVDSGYFSTPRAVEYPTENGRNAHAFFYPPRNRDYRAPEGETPPLLVKCHGGPTAATTTALRLEIQYWTSRGVGVLDVNYGGSTGYGRGYRERLNGQWGVVDVDDCVNGARHLVEHGEADGARCAITGGSAGGFTVLNALTFRNLFRAGASHYGVSDLKGLIEDTHKFESRYLNRLVGPYPERADLYRERSSINFAEELSCPVIFFQGLEDKVVPPNQAESMVEVLRRKRLPVAYVPSRVSSTAFAGRRTSGARSTASSTSTRASSASTWPSRSSPSHRESVT